MKTRVASLALALALAGTLPAAFPLPAFAEDKVVATINGKPVTDADLAVAEGEIGELVMTTLDRQAMPLLRFRTGDLTRILPGTCPCGRTHRRLDRITGRSDDMFIVKGCNIFPMQIEGVLMKTPDLGSNYLLTLETINGVDELIIEVEVARRVDLGDGRRLEWLSATLTRQIRDEILVTPIVKLLPPDTLPQSEGKAVRVRERRQL